MVENDQQATARDQRSFRVIHLPGLRLESFAMPMQPTLVATPVPADLLVPQAAITVAARTCLLEGPAFDSDGSLYFSDIIGNRVYRMGPDGVLSVFRADSGRTNGNTFDAHGLLISCEGAEFGPGGRRRLVRTDLKTGRIEVLTERFEGKRYNSPNDVIVDTKGRIWFTDPFYWDDRSALEMTDEAVYRIDPDGTVVRVVSQPQIERPNGLAITPDARVLYVIDSHTRPGEVIARSGRLMSIRTAG
jgi:gluconolactonase